MLNISLMQNNISDEDKEVLIQFIKTSDRFTNGPKVIEFENTWSKWLGVKYSVFVNSGASANLITMAAIREVYGTGEVIVPPIAWSSDISSVLLAGMKPVFADVSFDTLAMRDEEILSKITSETKAVFLTHVLGFNGITQKLLDELDRRGILLIEDVCESHGASFNGKKCGSIGFASNFSFYYAHHMSTIEGGMICTNDEKFYQYLRLLRSHGMIRESNNPEFKEEIIKEYPNLRPEFLFLLPGFNVRSTELNAVLGLNQIKRLDSNNEKRVHNFELFIKNLDSSKYYTDFSMAGAVNYAFVVLLRNPDKEFFDRVVSALAENNVEFRRGTAGGGNLARQPFVQKYVPNADPDALVNADFIHSFGLYTGNFPQLSDDKILGLCDLLNNVN